MVNMSSAIDSLGKWAQSLGGPSGGQSNGPSQGADSTASGGAGGGASSPFKGDIPKLGGAQAPGAPGGMGQQLPIQSIDGNFNAII